MADANRAGAPPIDVVIDHNPDCGTARNTLARIRDAGIEPHVVEYRRTPPSRALVDRLAARSGDGLRGLLRKAGTPYAALGLGAPSLTDDALLDAIAALPSLLNRPRVVTPKGVRLCRPSETVLGLRPVQGGAFAREDGEPVLDADGRRVAGV